MRTPSTIGRFRSICFKGEKFIEHRLNFEFNIIEIYINLKKGLNMPQLMKQHDDLMFL